MSQFSEEKLVRKLDTLNNTPNSIQTLSLYCLHNKRNSKQIVDVWLREFKRERKAGKLLSLIYLANDVIQNCRRKHPQYQEHFKRILTVAMAHFGRYADEKVLQSMKRVLTVWKDRGVYSTTTIHAITYALTSNIRSSQLHIFSDMSTTPPRDEKGITGSPTTSQNTGPSTPDINTMAYTDEEVSAIAAPGGSAGSAAVGGGIEDEEPTVASILASPKKDEKAEEPEETPPTTQELIAALVKLEDPPSADASTRGQIAAFPESVANPAFLKNIARFEQAEALYKTVKEAEPVVVSYCKKLSEEQDEREKTQEMLTAYLKAQKKKAERTQDLLNQFKEKKAALAKEKEEVYKHYESLPDMDTLPTSKLAHPLPKPSDLFSSSSTMS